MALEGAQVFKYRASSTFQISTHAHLKQHTHKHTGTSSLDKELQPPFYLPPT